jgi:glycylpeptide N-tetradecanoyltransferase
MTDLDVKQQHKFWNTQPVVQRDEKDIQIGVIDPNNDVEQVRKDPYPLPEDFFWVEVDTQNEEQRLELYEFLCKHYVIHPQNTFRFAYSAEFLNWALHPPGWKPEWHIGVRKKTDTGSILVAFISATPITLLQDEEVLPMVAVDFLSVHQGLRGKFMAPVLIKEITRRVNLHGIFQAVFTAGKELTQPFTKAQYFHRLINYKKLVAIKFTSLKLGADIEKISRQHSVNQHFANIPGFREMEEKDIPTVTEQLNAYNKQFPISQQFTEEEVRHNFKPRKGIVGSYVVEKKKKVVAFFSFYIVPSTVNGCEEYDSYTAAYAYYYFAKPSMLNDIAKACLYMASKEYDVDVFNCLNVQDNKSFIDALRFVPGDGNLHYYLFNYAHPPIKPEKCCIILL